MEAGNGRILSTESLTRRNTSRQRSEGRNLNGRWLFLWMVLKKDKGRHHGVWYQSASISLTMSPTNVDWRVIPDSEDYDLKASVRKTPKKNEGRTISDPASIAFLIGCRFAFYPSNQSGVSQYVQRTGVLSVFPETDDHAASQAAPSQDRV